MKLNQFPELSAVSDDDLFLVWDAESATTRFVKATNFKAYSSPSISQYKDLTYSSNGDANGCFYFLGTNKSGIGWSNPLYSGLLGISMSSYYDIASFDIQRIVNRSDDPGIVTGNIANSWIKIDLKSAKLIPNYYSTRQRSSGTNGLNKNWKIQGSNDDYNWTDLDTKTNITLNNSQWYSAAISSAISYRFFRLFQNGLTNTNDNYLTLGEFEIYGRLIW